MTATPTTGTSPRVRPGPTLLALAGAATLVATLLDLRVPGAHRTAIDVEAGWTAGVPGIALAWAGAAVSAHDRRNKLGWVLGAFGLWWAVDGLAGSWLAFATWHDPFLPGASAAFWVYLRLGGGLLLILPLILVLYPGGRLPAGRWRVAAVSALVAVASLPVILVLVPQAVAEGVSGSVPGELRSLDLGTVSLGLPDPVWEALLRLSYVAVALSLVPALAVVVHRYRSATGIGRVRMRWLLWAAVVDLLVLLTFRLIPEVVTSVGLTLAVLATAGSVAVGVTRPDLVDVDRLLGGTLLYGVLLVSAFVVDVLVLGVTGRLLGARLETDQALVVAVFLVTAVYAPLRHRIWQLARRGVVGGREDPYAVVSALAERLEDSPASGEQLHEVARAVAAAFRTSYVGVVIRRAGGEELLAEQGRRPERTRELPISYRGEQIGRLVLPSDGLSSRLRPADERLLADVVRQAAAAARAAELANELQRSRERLVTAVEDERRRLRRELHDGLGPSLAAVASRIDTARITAVRSPEEADRVLGQARQEVAGMLGEVRRLVHGLRPPALDDVGLERAVEQLAGHLCPPPLTVEVVATEDLGQLPAAVEVAAYRIAAEALTNVVRHAGASRCTVRLSAEPGELVVEVVDDGAGIAPETRAGVGLLSLRERAEELGGRTDVTAGAPHGTRVRAVLPWSSPRLAAPAPGTAGDRRG